MLATKIYRQGIVSFFFVITFSGCFTSGCGTKPDPDTSSRSVKVDGQLVTFEEQGWTNSDAEWFYSVSQGSQLVPYDWLAHLEDLDGAGLFKDKLAGFGYIPRNATDQNPLGLPVGFAKDEGKSRSWVGLTCAACHTTLIEYDNKSYLVDGGPGSGDLEALLKSLLKALQATKNRPDRFDRFAKTVLGNRDSEEERKTLKKQMETNIALRKNYNDRNLSKDSKHRSGFGRIDAFGAILNEVTVRFIGEDENHKPANAPVSYPFLWDTPHHDKVQWNGAAPNDTLGGPLARNVGEVLGVFGNVTIPETPPPALNPGYASTVQFKNMLAIEARVKKLKSPLWPKTFPPIGKTEKDNGRGLFELHCAKCHTLDFDRDDADRQIKAKMNDVGTDPLMAQNFRERTAKTGKLEGSRININPLGPKFGPTASGETLLGHVVIRTIVGFGKEAPDVLAWDLKSGGINQYKARPLNGVWATGPFLHNGSVPTLRDLLKPAKKRHPTFWVGSRKFYPEDVGFESKTKPKNGVLFDTSVPGNSKDGHEYGVGISEDDGGDGVKLEPSEIEDILEFLRSL